MCEQVPWCSVSKHIQYLHFFYMCTHTVKVRMITHNSLYMYHGVEITLVSQKVMAQLVQLHVAQ